jgi:hypothetical protein
MADKEFTGKNVLMPEVFVSNHMKQQRNYVHYKRNKNKITIGEKAATRFNSNIMNAILEPSQQVAENGLLLIVRIKGKNMGTTPQA